MKNKYNKPIAAVFLFVISFTASSLFAQTKPWVDGDDTGYSGYGLTASQIDYSAVSVVIDFAVVINSDGSLGP